MTLQVGDCARFTGDPLHQPADVIVMGMPQGRWVAVATLGICNVYLVSIEALSNVTH